jgi:hypothetical protein
VLLGTAGTEVKSGKRAERKQKPGKHNRVTAPCESWSSDPSRDVLEGPLHDVVVREKASSGPSRPGRGAGRTRFVRARRTSGSLTRIHPHPLPQHLLKPSLSTVTSVKISPAGRAPSVARGLPVALDVPRVWEDLAVGAVQAALADKFPQVRRVQPQCPALSLNNTSSMRRALVGEPRPFEDDILLQDAGLTEAAHELAAKDSSPQISWRTVFLVGGVRYPCACVWRRGFDAAPVWPILDSPAVLLCSADVSRLRCAAQHAPSVRCSS